MNGLKKNKKVLWAIAFISIFTFYKCDSYKAREKLVFEISETCKNNEKEFEIVHDYIFKDSLSKRLVLNNRNRKIEINEGGKTFEVDSISEIKENIETYEILSFMEKENIYIISGNPIEKWIVVAFNTHKYPCFSFWYKKDFDINKKDIQQKIINFKNTKTKKWIYPIKDKWYIQGEKCW